MVICTYSACRHLWFMCTTSAPVEVFLFYELYPERTAWSQTADTMIQYAAVTFLRAF